MGDEVQSYSSGWRRAWTLTQMTTTLIATAVALIAAAGFLIPPLGTVVNLVTAWRFGATGYIYYEIGDNRDLTDDGQLYLPRAGEGTYADLKVGDKLQAAPEVKFYATPGKASPKIFLLGKGDCVIVLSKAGEYPVKKARSGGWLKVRQQPADCLDERGWS